MPTTRKKTTKTVYKDEESEGETGDFSDSGSEAKISEASSSEDDLDDAEDDRSSGDDFRNKTKKRTKNPPPIRRRPKPFAKELIKKINKQDLAIGNDENIELPLFSIKDLTDADKLLPSVLNLSESDSSDDECQSQSSRKKAAPILTSIQEQQADSDDDGKVEYRDVWSTNIQDNSEDIAKKTFMELEKHNSEIEKTKASVESYIAKNNVSGAFDVKDLLARGEEVADQVIPVKKKGKAKIRRDSDSEVEDWEEVKESKIPQQGLQLIVELPNAVCRKSKTVDVEMMMKRKINRVKKEYQVYMHKVHVLCWLGHGNFVSRVLNDQEVMAAALAMVPKGCYPEERLSMKYVEQITTWYKDKLTLKQDKHEHKFRPKAPPLKDTILKQIKSRITTTKKYNILIFVAMLRALGLQCRIMFNFVAVPIRPPSSELCSLSIKPKDDTDKLNDKSAEKASEKSAGKGQLKATLKSKGKCKKMAQVDGIDDTLSETDVDTEKSIMQIDDSDICNETESDYENIMQIDGNDDTQNTRSTRAGRARKADNLKIKKEEGAGVSPPKRSKTSVASEKNTESSGTNEQKEPTKSRTKRSVKNIDNVVENTEVPNTSEDKQEQALKPQTRRLARSKNVESNKDDVSGDNGDSGQALKSKISTKSVNKETPKSDTSNTTEMKVINADNHNSQKAQTRRSAKSNLTSKVTHGPEAEELDPPKSPLRRQRNTSKDENASAKNRESSKSPQTRNKISTLDTDKQNVVAKVNLSPKTSLSLLKPQNDDKGGNKMVNAPSPRKTRSNRRNTEKTATNGNDPWPKTVLPTILVTDDNSKQVKSDFFCETKESTKRNVTLSRKRSHTTIVNQAQKSEGSKDMKPKTRGKSAPGDSVEKSKYFDSGVSPTKKPRLNTKPIKKEEMLEDKLRVSHRDLSKPIPKLKNDVTGDLVDIIKGRIRIEKAEAKKGIVKGKVKDDSGDDSDFLPVEDPKSNDDSDDDFKPTKISPRPVSKINPKAGTSKKIDRRVLSSDDDVVKMNKVDVWCEVFVEELEQWIAVDAIKGKVHCSNELYTQATHPVCYIVGWDNNNYLKDLTRRYVPHWNTVTRKQRAEPDWWKTALQPWLGPKTARDKEEDEYLDRMQLEAPLPKSIAEYKNHPLYALKRHLLKFEAMYPPDAATLGFVRGEAVYARDCVYTCRSRDTWLKEAKIVKLGEEPYKVVKARPKWDKLSNKLITDKPLEVFGPWQVQDYEPPTAENGIVPRNAYGNVELFKDCMLPKKTVHIKLPGLNRVAKKLNIDCAPAMTGFDFNGGWSHPVYDGFVVCEEFEEIITEAWVKDQEDQERREREKMEARVFGNWRRLIRGLMIRERLKIKYGFEEPTTSETKKPKGPRLVVKKR